MASPFGRVRGRGEELAEPLTFWNALVQWIGKSFGLALLPFLAKFAVAPSGPHGAEFCIFVMVLGATGLLEAAFATQSTLTRTLLVFWGIASVAYGAIGYDQLTISSAFPGGGPLSIVAWSLAASYGTYKVPLLWDQCNG